MCPNCFRTLQRETQQNKVKKFQRTTLALYIESLYRVSIPPLRGGGGGLLLHRQNWSPFSPVLTVDGVLANGGGLGIAKAFANAHENTPIIYLANSGSELGWWWKEYSRNGYTTESMSSSPGVSTAAFW